MEFIYYASTIVEWAMKVYFWMHLIAFLLSWVAADPSNPLVQFIHRMTLPLWHRVELASPQILKPLAAYLALMLVLFLEIFLPGLVRSLGATLLGQVGSVEGVINLGFYFIIGVLTITSHVFSFLFFVALLWFILTLVNPPLTNPLVRSLYLLLDPLLSPIQRRLPRMQVDLSPLLLALGGYLASSFVQGLVPSLSRNLVV